MKCSLLQPGLDLDIGEEVQLETMLLAERQLSEQGFVHGHGLTANHATVFRPVVRVLLRRWFKQMLFGRQRFRPSRLNDCEMEDPTSASGR